MPSAPPVVAVDQAHNLRQMMVTLVLDLLRKFVVPSARESGGTFFVEYPWPFKVVAILSWLTALAIIGLILHPSTGVLPAFGEVIAFAFVGLAAFLHSEMFIARIAYGIGGIRVFSRWGGQKAFVWSEIKSVEFSAPGQIYIVRAAGEKQFTFRHFMSGYQSLLEEIRRRSAKNMTSAHE